MKYNFRVGDYVEDVTGRTGYISSFCNCKFCKERGFYEPHVIYSNGDFDYITIYEYEKGFPSYKRIGRYEFTEKNDDKKNDDKIEPLCEEYIKSFPICNPITTENGLDWHSVDIGDISKKINELVDAVNKLRGKHESD